jgi:hypothetical protein
MNINFSKITALATSALMVGMTMGSAIALSPSDSTFDAVVYGSQANALDHTSADSIATWLGLEGSSSSTTVGGDGINENEVPLGGPLNVSTSKIITTLTDAKIDSLLDTKLNWDDGGASGADDYNIHEEILVGDMAIQTTFNDNDFEGVTLTNDKALTYKYVFDDVMNCTGISSTNTLELEILGQTMEVQGLTASTVTVTLAPEKSFKVGDVYNDPTGKVVTIEGIFSTSMEVSVDGVSDIISDGSTETVNNLKVAVTGIGYNSNAPETSVVILKIGEDISKTYSTGEAYVGEDEDDPLWVWDITTACTAGGHIGVKYNHKETRDTDNVVYEGGSYVFPHSFGEVKFNALTAVDYEDFRMYFDLTEDLWNNTDLTSTAQTLDAPVLILEATDGRKDAITLTTGAQETNKIYLRWASSTTETQGTQTNASLEVFYSDVDGTIQDAVRPRFSVAYGSTSNATGTIANSDIGDIIVGDTTIAINAKVTAGNLIINFTDGGAAQQFSVDVGGIYLNHSTGALKWFGGDVEGTDAEDGLATDMLVATTNVGTYDNDLMTYQGIIIKTPEGNLDNDEVVFSVPDDRVYAEVSVLTGGTTSTDTTGSMVFMDTETGWNNKNVILIGGSCINTAAATALGVQPGTCGAAFTDATNVGTGQYIIKTVSDAFGNGKIAMVIAGYEKENTEAAANYLRSNGAEIEAVAGKGYFGNTAVEGGITVTEI